MKLRCPLLLLLRWRGAGNRQRNLIILGKYGINSFSCTFIIGAYLRQWPSAHEFSAKLGGIIFNTAGIIGKAQQTNAAFGAGYKNRSQKSAGIAKPQMHPAAAPAKIAGRCRVKADKQIMRPTAAGKPGIPRRRQYSIPGGKPLLDFRQSQSRRKLPRRHANPLLKPALKETRRQVCRPRRIIERGGFAILQPLHCRRHLPIIIAAVCHNGNCRTIYAANAIRILLQCFFMPKTAAVFLAAFALCAIAAATFANSHNILRIAATTSLDNSGLLASLIPLFEKECQCRVRVIVAGTGKALKLGERGDVDMLLVHAPETEKQYIKNKHGIGRQTIMHNTFILAGPPNDPAAAANAPSIGAAMQIIAQKRALFVSRGDDSGTHKKEMHLWQNKTPGGKWYIAAGAGMGRALLMADEKRAYILSDSATFATLRDKTDLRIIATNNPPLKNEYSTIIINPARHPHINIKLARRFGK